MRFCMSAMTLRSNQTMNIVRPGRREDDDDLEQHDSGGQRRGLAVVTAS
jgi:hypothetical protein